MKIELNEIENSMEDETSKLDLKKKTVYLLPNADENMEKLKVGTKRFLLHSTFPSDDLGSSKRGNCTTFEERPS